MNGEDDFARYHMQQKAKQQSNGDNMKDFTMMNQTECIEALNKEISNLKEDQILDRAIILKLRSDNEKLTSIIARVTE